MHRMKHFLSTTIALAVSWVTLAIAQPVTGEMLADGDRLAATGDYQGAIAIYLKIANEKPDSPEVFVKLAGAQLLGNRHMEAVQNFQRAVSLGDNGARSFLGRGMAYLHLGQFGAARAAFVEARSRGTSNPQEVDRVVAWIDARS